MKRLITAVIILLTTTSAFAAEYFTDKDLKDLRIIEIRDGKVVMEDKDGKTEIQKGDKIGSARGTVIEIGKAHITVQIEEARTRLLLMQGVEK